MSVVDTPGLNDSEHEEADIKHARFARKYMTKAFNVCQEGFDALLIVLNITNRYTVEEQNVIKLLIYIFGEVMFDHTGLIFTRGDNFDKENKLHDADRSQYFFKSWCKDQKGDLGELLKKCQYRAVLFHNTDTYKLQRDVELLALENEVKKISTKGARYTEIIFQRNERNRKELILNRHLPELEKEIDEKLLFLKKELQLIISDGAIITDTVKVVLEAIDKQGFMYPTLDTLKDDLGKLLRDFKHQATNQAKFHLTTKIQEIIDGLVIRELKSLSNIIESLRKPEEHKGDLKYKANRLAWYIDEEACETNKLDGSKNKVKLILLEINDLDTKGSGTLTEHK